MERTSGTTARTSLDLAALFSDLVRLETELWDLVDARLRRDHDLALSWFEPMQVVDPHAWLRVIDIAEGLPDHDRRHEQAGRPDRERG